MVYAFRAVERRDFTVLRRWFSEPHVLAWWDGETEACLAEIAAAMDDDATEPLIVEWQGKPIAYLQAYDPHLEDDHPYQDQPFGTLGVDMAIGDPDLIGRGHGSAILDAFAEMVFEEGAPRVLVDPSPRNSRAVRAYEKAGFVRIEERDTPFGHVLMMARDAPED